MERRIKYGTAAFALLLAILALYSYLTHRNDNGRSRLQDSAIPITAFDLAHSFEKNETVSNQTYLNKILSVRGVIKDIRKDEHGGYLVDLGSRRDLPFSVHCSLDDLYTRHDLPVKKGDSCAISGTCAGLLTNIVLLQCVIEK